MPQKARHAQIYLKNRRPEPVPMPSDTGEWIDANQAAAIIGCSKSYAYMLINEGKLGESRRFGKYKGLRVQKHLVEQYLEEKIEAEPEAEVETEE